MSDPFLDSTALADLQTSAGPEFAKLLFAQIRADFALLHDEALAQMRGYGPAAMPDYDATRRVAHEMKGLSLTVGASALAQLCAEVETLAQENAGPALGRMLPEIIAVCDRVRIELEQSIAGAE